MIDQDRIEQLLEQATVDCYDEIEEFMGVLSTLEQSLVFPLQATVMGEIVEVIGLDSRRSSPGRGIVALIRKNGNEYRLGLSELTFIDPDPVSVEWLAVFEYWSGY